MKVIDLTGQRFGRLVVQERAHGVQTNRVTWSCLCDCGKGHLATATLLRAGRVKSCGCLRVDLGKEKGASSRKHGHASNGNSPEYQAWSLMKHRCTNRSSPNWDRYGGRGIKVCDRWMNSFEAFLEDMGPRPVTKAGRRSRFSIDREDNDGNYEPDNCRWATIKQQNNNTSFNRHITIDGVTKPLKEWLGLRGVNRKTFYNRLASGYTEEQALKPFAFQPGRKPRAR